MVAAPGVEPGVALPDAYEAPERPSFATAESEKWSRDAGVEPASSSL